MLTVHHFFFLRKLAYKLCPIYSLKHYFILQDCRNFLFIPALQRFLAATESASTIHIKLLHVSTQQISM